MVSTMKARWITILAVAILVLLTACATSPSPEKGIVDTTTEPLSEDEGIVFGVLVPQSFDSKGRQLEGKAVPEIAYEVFYGGTENITIQRAFTGLNDSIPGNTRQPQTFFAMKLSAGEYSMFKLYRPFQGQSGFIPTDVRFKVEPNKATYIGSLQIQFRATRGLFGEERNAEKVTLKVADDTANATRVFKERNPDARQEIVTTLMTTTRR